MEIRVTKGLMKVFAAEKKEGEKAYELDRRVIEEAELLLEQSDNGRQATAESLRYSNIRYRMLA